MTVMESHNKLFRHGDVDGIPLELTSLSSIPLDARPAGKTLMHGEATGHHHSVKNGQVLQLEKPIQVEVDGETVQVEKFLQLDKSTVLEHQEHKTRILQPGTYIIPQERSYNPFDEQIRRAVD
jgi:hypothetical protein